MAAASTGAATAGGAGLVSRGIKGVIRQRLLTDMIHSVPGTMKVMIVDEGSVRIVSACMHMSDLMENGVTLVEQLKQVRQPVRVSPAIYFISATDAAIDMVIADWATRDQYQSAHVFFTTRCPDTMLRKFGPARVRTAGKLLAVKDMCIDFSCPETLVFQFNQTPNIPFYFGALAGPGALESCASRLANVFRSCQDVPAIRFYSSERAAEVARQVNESMAGDLATNPEWNRGSIALILDRSFDIVQPFMHELTYQAMLADLLPLENDTFSIKSPKEPSKMLKFLIDESDPLWIKLRHQHISVVLSELPQMKARLDAANPKIVNLATLKSKMSPSDLAEVTRAMPAYEAEKDKLELHSTIATAVLEKYNTRHLGGVSSFEIQLVTGEEAPGQKAKPAEILRSIKAVLMDTTIDINVKARALALFIVLQGEEKKEEILRECRVPDSQTALLSKLAAFQPWTAEKKARIRRSAPAAGDLMTNRYECHFKTVVSQLLAETLSQETYPYAPGCAQRAAAKPAPKISTAAGRFGAAKKVNEFTLDFGHGDSIPLATPARVYVFIVGGCTYGEIRCAYEISKATNREVVVGGTAILTPESFIGELNGLSA